MFAQQELVKMKIEERTNVFSLSEGHVKLC